MSFLFILVNFSLHTLLAGALMLFVFDEIYFFKIVVSFPLKTQDVSQFCSQRQFFPESQLCDTFLDRYIFSKKIWNAKKSKDESNKKTEEYSADKLGGKFMTTAAHKKQTHSKFLPYKMENVVDCLDSLAIRKNRSIHIAFVGDSVVRHHFSTFIQVR